MNDVDRSYFQTFMICSFVAHSELGRFACMVAGMVIFLKGLYTMKKHA